MGRPSNWTDEQDLLLLNWREKGVSFRNISKALKTKTRNACLGRYHRLKRELQD